MAKLLVTLLGNDGNLINGSVDSKVWSVRRPFTSVACRKCTRRLHFPAEMVFFACHLHKEELREL